MTVSFKIDDHTYLDTWAAPGQTLLIPRRGDFVRINEKISGKVFSVLWDYSSSPTDSRVIVTLDSEQQP